MGRPCAASQRGRPSAAGSRTDCTICGARPRWAAMRNSRPSVSGRSTATRVGRMTSPMASRNVSSTRRRSKPAAKTRLNALSTRASAALSHDVSSAAAARAVGSGVEGERSILISRMSRCLSRACRRTVSSSRVVKPSGTMKSAVASSSPAAPTATTSAPGATSRAPLTNVLRAPAGPALSRSTRSISTRRSVLMASASEGASKIVKPPSPRNRRVRSASSGVTIKTVFTRSPGR